MRLARPAFAWPLAALLLATPLANPLAADEAEKLGAVEAALAAEEAAAAELAAQGARIRAEVEALTAESVAVAAAAQALEHELSTVEATLAGLAEEVLLRESALADDRVALALTLGALLRIALQPPEALLAQPAAPLETVRSAMLLRVAVPELEARAASLVAELDALAGLQREIEAETASAVVKQAELQARQARLAALLSRKESLAAITADAEAAAAARVAGLAAAAEDLRALIAELEREAEAARLAAQEQARVLAAARAQAEAEAAAAREAAARAAAEAEAAAALAAQAAAEAKAAAEAEAARAQAAAAEAEAEAAAAAATAEAVPAEGDAQQALAAPDSLRAFPETPGGLFLPAAGALAASWGDPLPDRLGESSEGFLIETRPGAQIVATFDGRIVYAGTFRRYGLILIIEHGNRYHSLLAGLGRIDVVLGQWVVAGEPVGLMASPPDQMPLLYLELRQNGLPIDPRPLFANQLSKSEG